MPKFSQRSLGRLNTCDEKLQRLFNEVVKFYDCTILCGHRNEQDQNEAYRSGMSQVRWPNSKHNSNPSVAVDVVPYPIDWNDKVRFYHFAGFVLGIAKEMGINITWGGDWNRNNNLKDQSFFDLPHFELVD